MPSADDLTAHATSTTDFYALLSLPPTFSQKELDRAWRLTARKYHPDKVGPNNPEAAQQFLLANIGFELLGDPTLRALYDGTRHAREQKRRANEALEGRRRQMKDELEGRERGVKRAWDASAGWEDASGLEREVKRLAEEGARRRKEREEEAIRERTERERDQRPREGGEEQEEEGGHAATHAPLRAPPSAPAAAAPVAEIDRTVRARFPVPRPASMTPSALHGLFAPFGGIESTFLSKKEKRARLGSAPAKRLVGTGYVVFKSVVGAHAAVSEWEAEKERKLKSSAAGDAAAAAAWEAIEEVGWAGDTVPEWVRLEEERKACLAAATAATDQGTTAADGNEDAHDNSSRRDGGTATGPSTPVRRNPFDFLKRNHTANDLRRVPSFASFAGMPKRPMTATMTEAGPGSPSLEELTMIRLREAERRRAERERVLVDMEREEDGDR